MKKLTDEEKSWLNNRFNQLEVNETDTSFCLAGDLIFDMVYDPNIKGEYIVFPQATYYSHPKYIQDKYKIKVEYNNGYFIPKVFETDERMKLFAQKNKMPLCDLHVYPNDGCLCLCPKTMEKIILSNNYNSSRNRLRF